MSIKAPYNFAPLSRFVYFPDWAEQVSHDRPFQDGLSGKLTLTVTAHTPILAAGEQEGQDKTFFKMPLEDNGSIVQKEVIPGSTFRGMVRNVLEIASFGKFSRVDDRTLSIRDLSSGARGLYGAKLTRTHLVQDKHSKRSYEVYEALSRGGWLEFDNERREWLVTPCSIARVEYDDLNKLAGIPDLFEKIKTKKVGSKDVRRNVSCEEKYEAWHTNSKSLSVNFTLVKDARGAPLTDHPHSKGKKLRYHKVDPDTLRFSATPPTGPSNKIGHLVFTGQTGAGNKHMEFVFFDAKSEKVPIDNAVMQSFLSIHEGTKEWKYLQGLPDVAQAPGIPVFYLPGPSGRPNYIGLAQMFRLGYEDSIGASISKVNPAHQDKMASPDLPELIFGGAVDFDEAMVNERAPSSQDSGLKARVQFSHFKPIAPLAKCRNVPKLVVLNSPRPSYYPNYVRQDVQVNRDALDIFPGTRDSRYFRSYSDQKFQTTGSNGVTVTLQAGEPRGWKRYPVRSNLSDVQSKGCAGCPAIPDWAAPPRENNADDGDNRVVSRLFPLCPNNKFEGTMNFHNLRPVELGALLWVLSWGGNNTRRHSIGMAKALGWGQIDVKVDTAKWESAVFANDPNVKNLAAPDFCIEKFVEAMNAYASTQCGNGGTAQNWVDSEQIVQLLAMAEPAAARLHDLEHMKLNQGIRDGNEFVNAKRDGQVLPEYVRFTGKRDVELNFLEATETAKDESSKAVQWIRNNANAVAVANNAKPEEVKYGRPMMEKWVQIDDFTLKTSVAAEIIRLAKEGARYDNPGKSWKNARTAYEQWLKDNHVQAE